MTTTLQEALLNAGLITKEKMDRADAKKKGNFKKKSHASPKPAPRIEESRSVLHEGKHEHHMRTECENCKKSGPDIEYYDHKNRLLNVKWLCIKCADHYKINDQVRLTEQSQFAKSRMFQREYGATKTFS